MSRLREGTIVRQARTPLGMMKIHMEPIAYQVMQKYRGECRIDGIKYPFAITVWDSEPAVVVWIEERPEVSGIEGIVFIVTGKQIGRAHV